MQKGDACLRAGILMPFRQHVASEEEFKATLAKVEQDFKSQVVRIRWNVAPDWQEEECLFFRIVLRDAAWRRLAPVIRQLTERLQDEVRTANIGWPQHFNFRTQSEQKALGEKEWE